MCDMGIGASIIRWIQSWLANRKAWVEFDGVKGKTKTFSQGLPQGAVLSPTLFLIYINDVTENLPEDVKISLFADDIAVWASSKNIREASDLLQRAIDSINGWSKKWLMTLNIEKCEVSLFTLDQAQANTEIKVSIEGKELKNNKFPTFLGITYDRRLTFSEHVRRVIEKCRGRNKMLYALGGTDWGFEKELMRTTYTTMTRSCIEYGSPAWMPWITKTDLDKLERVQHEAARKITGLLQSTPTEAVMMEAGLNTVKNRAQTAAVIAIERSERCQESNPRKMIMQEDNKRRIKKTELRDFARPIWNDLFEGTSSGWEFPPLTKPWIETCQMEYETEGKKTEDLARNKKEAMDKLETNKDYKYVLYTDGSARESRYNGGAAVVVTENDRVIASTKRAAGRWCSSYQTEMVAMNLALDWLLENAESWENARIVTDSKSSAESMRRTKYNTKNNLLKTIYEKLAKMTSKKITVTWVPSHCEVPGNELADVAAEEAANLDQTAVGWLFDVAKARCRASEPKIEIIHERSRETYQDKKIKEEEEAILTKDEVVKLRRLRTGHSTELGAYKKRIGMEGGESCRACRVEEETSEHLMRCPVLERLRGVHKIHQLRDLVVQPLDGNRFWKKVKEEFGQ